MSQLLKNAWQSFIEAGEIAQQENRLEDAAVLFQTALLEAHCCENAEQCFATTLDLLADTFQKLNRYEQAEEASLRSLRIKQNCESFTKADVLRAMLKLSKIYYAQSKLGAAAYTTNHVLQLSEQTLGFDHPAVGFVAQQLADLYSDLGSHKDAQLLYQRAYRLQRKQFASQAASYASYSSSSSRSSELACA
ncbi:tetratricopeptide repeat protein [bacterium]|nr:tetratricopeptide repeat protein [bacterium]MBP9807954.1 tetratricopeptide repeat protein [bacterium]